MIGDPGVGKTAMIKQACLGRFSRQYRATIGVDFVIKRIQCGDQMVRLQLWDVAGQERFGQMTRVYYKDAIGAIIVFDATRPETFDNIKNWKEDLDQKALLPDGSSLPCIILANKCDEPGKKGIVTTPEDLQNYVKSNGYVCALETSAKENINLEEALQRLSTEILKKKTLFPYIECPSTIENETFNLSQRIERMEGSANRSVTRTLEERSRKCHCN